MVERLRAPEATAGGDRATGALGFLAVEDAEAALAEARALMTIPNAGGRDSTKILPEPGVVLRVRERQARAIEGLLGAEGHRNAGR